MYTCIKPFVIVFTVALLLNLVWENTHSYLYEHYQGDIITEFILIKAALFDALVITIAAVLYVHVLRVRNRLAIAIGGLVIFAIGLELFALATSRWRYLPHMPIFPCLGVGITPVVQLALLAYTSFRVSGLLAKNDMHYTKNSDCTI